MRVVKILVMICLLVLMSCELEEKLDDAFIDISGKVTDDDKPVSQALVLLMESEEISEGMNLTNGTLTNSNGNYTIVNVEPGDYYIVAVDDENGNMEFDPDEDQFGFYGVNPDDLDIEPDVVTVDDEDVNNINITDLYNL